MVWWIIDYQVKARLSSMRPDDTIWRHMNLQTLVQVMAWYLTAPSHHLNQCGLIFSAILWHLHKAPFWRYIQDIYQWQQFENYQVKITAAFVRGQWVKHAIVLPIPNPSATLIQSSVVITRSNLSRYYTRYCDDSNSKITWLQTHNRHPIARPHYGLSIIRF